jgi:hypothetical protein
MLAGSQYFNLPWSHTASGAQDIAKLSSSQGKRGVGKPRDKIFRG